jgi:hypothetical protein
MMGLLAPDQSLPTRLRLSLILPPSTHFPHLRSLHQIHSTLFRPSMECPACLQQSSTLVSHLLSPTLPPLSTKCPARPRPPHLVHLIKTHQSFFLLPSEEEVLGLEEDVLGFHFTDFPPGSLSLECAGVVSPCAVADLGLHKDSWTNRIRAQRPQSTGLQDSLVHIVVQPQVCGIFGDGIRVCAFMLMDNTPHCGLYNSGANLCMTNNPNLLVEVCPCEPFTILLATTNGGHSHTNICRCRGLLPLPLLDGTTYYQTCFVNPYASGMFISPQAIINSSTGSFNKWQMEGFLQGRPGILSLYSTLGLMKMSIQLSQQDGLYYSSTDTFTVNTNPPSRSSPFIGSAFTDLPPDLHFIDDKDSSACSDNDYDNSIPPAAPAVLDNNPRTTTILIADATGSLTCIPTDLTLSRPPA